MLLALWPRRSAAELLRRRCHPYFFSSLPLLSPLSDSDDSSTPLPPPPLRRPRSPKTYSYKRPWLPKSKLNNLVFSALKSCGWDPHSLLTSQSSDDSDLAQAIFAIFHATADAAIAFYFFRLSRRSRGTGPHGLLTLSAMSHVAAAGNMNHIALLCISDLIASSPCRLSVFKALQCTAKSQESLQTVCSMLLRCYVKEKMVEASVDTLGRMRSLGLFPETGVYVILIELLLKFKQVDSAWEVFTGMPNWESCRKEVFLNLFMRELCVHGEFSRACELLFEMIRYGGMVDVVSFTIIINALCKKNLILEATDLFYNMIRMGVFPDYVVLSTVVDGYCKAGRSLEALDFFKYPGFVLDEFVYTSFLMKLCEDGNMDDASKLFSEMFEVGLIPDSVIYSTMIRGYCQLSWFKKALNFLCQMLKRGHKLSAMIYKLLIEGYCKVGNADEAEHLLILMRMNGLQPRAVFYNTVMDAYCKKRKLNKAYEMKDMMAEHKVPADAATYNILMNGLVKNGFLTESRGIFYELIRQGFSPDKFALTNLILAYCKLGKLEEAYLIWRGMSDRGQETDVVTCSALLSGFCRSRRMHEAGILFQRMLNNGLIPDVVVYSIMIRGYCTEGNISEAVHLLSNMEERRISPNGDTYWALVHGLEKIGVKNPTECAAMKIEKIFMTSDDRQLWNA